MDLKCTEGCQLPKEKLSPTHHSWKKCQRYRQHFAVSKPLCLLAQDTSGQTLSSNASDIEGIYK